MDRQFQQVDVFATTPLSGNPLAVVLDGSGLSDDSMQRFANWTNLSETTFVFPPNDTRADYRVRIFTASAELPFAGHPTLGTCHVWLTNGGRPQNHAEIIQECGVGLVRVRRSENGDLAFAAPPLIRSGPIDWATRAAVVEQLQITDDEIVDVEWIDNGPGWIGVLLASDEAVLAMRPSRVGHLKLGVVGLTKPGMSHAIEVRGLFPAPDGTVFEDPVTGSMNASVAQWLLGTGRLQSPYIARQGTAIGRAGRISIEEVGADVWVGGKTVTRVTGSVEIDT
jgi:PhzF family phenazine biosynthesis protein